MERRDNTNPYDAQRTAPTNDAARTTGTPVTSTVIDTGRGVEPTVTRADIYSVMTPGVGMGVRDMTRWGPIFAGFFVSLGLIALLAVLGTALGLQFGVTPTPGSPPGTPGAAPTTNNLDVAAAIYGAIALFVAFLVGGWVTGRTAGIGGETSGWIHGVAVWAVTVSVLLALGAFGLSGAVGAAANAVGPGGINPAPSGTTPNVDPVQTLQAARGTAWGTFIALLLGLVASTLGGWMGGKTGEPEINDRIDRTDRTVHA